MMAEEGREMEGSRLKRSWACLKEVESQNAAERDTLDYHEPPEIVKRQRREDDFADDLSNRELSVSCYNREHSAGSGTDDSVETEAIDTRGSADSAVSQSEETTDDDDDNVSEISDISGISIEGWRTVSSGPMAWVQQQMMSGQDPLPILRSLIPDDTHIPSQLDDLTLWKIIINLLSEPPRRNKLSHVNTLDDVVSLMRTCKNIMVLTGAGVSVSCGIPDFRSRDGVYARLAQEYPDLPDPQAMFDITYFRRNPRPFFKFAKEIYPGQFKPSPCHQFIKMLEDRGKLLRNYTQNIDTLEQVAGISRVIQCHGSFATASCMNCQHKVDAEAIKKDIMNQVIPACSQCDAENPTAIMKPDIVFFGESLPEEFHRQMELDRDQCDLLIVIGSSLKVRPVALVPNSLPANIPQILINREPLKHLNFDVELLGDCDVIISELCHKLGEDWNALCHSAEPAKQTTLEEYYSMYVTSAMKVDTGVSSTDDCSQMSVTDTQTDGDTDVPSDDTDSTMFSVNMTVDDSCSSVTMADSAQTLVQVNHVESTGTDIENETLTSINRQNTQLDIQTTEDSNMNYGENPSFVNAENSNLNTGLMYDNQQSDLFTHNQAVNSVTSQREITAVTHTHAEPSATSQREITAVTHTHGEPSASCDIFSSWSQQNENEASANQQQTNLTSRSGEDSSTVHNECSSWQPKYIVARHIPESMYVYMEPCRYIFHGAEVSLDVDDDDDQNSISDSSDDDDRDLEPSSQTGLFSSPTQVVSSDLHPTTD